MKVNKLLSLDLDVVELLKKEENASKVANTALRDYYQISTISKLGLEAINKLKEINAEKKAKEQEWKEREEKIIHGA